MTEWSVVGVIIALVGLGAAIIKPILSLNTTITELTISAKQLRDNIAELANENTKSHRRLFEKNDEQDLTLSDHECRIKRLESQGEHTCEKE